MGQVNFDEERAGKGEQESQLVRNGSQGAGRWARRAAKGLGAGDLVGPGKDQMDQKKGFVLWKDPQRHPCH